MSKLYIVLCLFFLNIQYNYAQKYNKKDVDSIKNLLYYCHNESKIHEGMTNALKGVKLALQLSKNIKHDSLIAVCEATITNYYFKLGDYTNGEKLFSKTFAKLKKMKSYKSISSLANNMGLHYSKNNQLNKSIKYFILAYDYQIKAFGEVKYTSCLTNLSRVYYKQKKYKRSKKIALQVLDIVQNKGLDTFKTANIHGHLGALALKLNELPQALKHFKISSKLFNDIDIVAGLLENEHYLRTYYESINDTSNYLKHAYKELQHLHVLHNRMKDKTKTQIKTYADLNGLVQKLELSEKEALIEKEKNSRLYIIIICIALCLVFSILLTLVITKKNKHLKKLTIKAEAGLKEKNKFISMISHELRTPLNSVIGFSQFLIEEEYLPHQIQYLKPLKSSGEYLLNLINNVLGLNKSDYKGDILNFSTINIKTKIHEITNSFKKQLETHNTTLHTNIDTGLPKFLKTDALKFSQILINIIGNAVKFTKNGNITLTVKVLENKQEYSIISFEVKDDGIGISEKEQVSIFNEFTHKKFKDNREYDGAGLGLYIVQKFLKLMGSDILVESKIDKGSSFSFILNMEKPINKNNPPPTEKEILEIPQDYTQTLKGINVLAFEDNISNQLLLSKVLQKVKINYDFCENGEEGVMLFNSKPKNYYDLILMDLNMPKMDGFEATKQIRKTNKTIPILAVTAMSFNGKNSLTKHQITSVIHKPYKKEELYSECIKLLII